MTLTDIARIARRHADSLGKDATKWHRIACKARAKMLQAAREKRALEKRTTVAIPAEIAPGVSDLDPLDEDDTLTTENQDVPYGDNPNPST